MELKEFLDALASKSPVPGGGGAAALAGALGAALGSMACEISDNALADEAKSLSAKLFDCIERDAEAFLPLKAAYSDPTADMEACLHLAASVPMEILELCCDGIKLHSQLKDNCKASVLSDVATGAVLCWGAMYGAAVNVKANTKLMLDREYADRLNSKVDELMNEYWKTADAVYEEIYAAYC